MTDSGGALKICNGEEEVAHAKGSRKITETSRVSEERERNSKATCFNSTTDQSFFYSAEFAGQINGSISRCEIEFCECHYDTMTFEKEHLRKTSFKNNVLTLNGGSENSSYTQDYDWSAKSSGGSTIYSISYTSLVGMLNVFNESVNSN
jgi:hypothetical protein